MGRAFVRGHQSAGELHLSCDRKVSPRGIWQGPRRNRAGRWVPTVPNSFGLPSGTSCPGRTPFCRDCYAARSEQSQGVRELVEHNYHLLLEAGTTEAMATLLRGMVGRYLDEAQRLSLPASQLLFRVHWDGDFFSLSYARAWADTMAAFPGIRFWAYTRSFVPPVDVVPVLAPVSNLSLYLSVDQWNREAALDQVDHWPVRLALCAEDFRSARMLAEWPPAACPENARRIPLMDDGVGACVTCRICPDGRRDVLFSTSHQEDVTSPVVIRQTAAPAPAWQQEPVLRTCSNPDCGRNFNQPRGRGRPRLYCSDQCRWAVSRLPKERVIRV